MTGPPTPRACLNQLWWLLVAGIVLLALVLWRVASVSAPIAIPRSQADTQANLANGFNLDGRSVRREFVAAGAAARDAIPALTDPPLWEGAAVAGINERWRRERHKKALVPNDAVIGVEVNGEARAFPICILNWHEVVNCELGGLTLAVTYCPLTASPVVYELGGGQPHALAASGLLFNCNTLLYDTHAEPNTESLYCQLTGAAVSGPAARTGRNLKRIPMDLTLWGDWFTQHPGTTVLSMETGYSREYEADAYGNYYDRERLRFPAEAIPVQEGMSVMSRCLAVGEGGSWRIYPHALILKHAGHENVWRADGLVFSVLRPTAPALAPEVRVASLEGKPVNSIPGLWFALRALLPDAQLAE